MLWTALQELKNCNNSERHLMLQFGSFVPDEGGGGGKKVNCCALVLVLFTFTMNFKRWAKRRKTS